MTESEQLDCLKDLIKDAINLLPYYSNQEEWNRDDYTTPEFREWLLKVVDDLSTNLAYWESIGPHLADEHELEGRKAQVLDDIMGAYKEEMNGLIKSIVEGVATPLTEI